jgi:hypothetical protein
MKACLETEAMLPHDCKIECLGIVSFKFRLEKSDRAFKEIFDRGIEIEQRQNVEHDISSTDN